MFGFESRRLILVAVDRDFAVGHFDKVLDARELLIADLRNRQIGVRHARAEIILGGGDKLWRFLIAGGEAGTRMLGLPELKPLRRGRVGIAGRRGVIAVLSQREVAAVKGFGCKIGYGVHCRLLGPDC